MQPQLYSAYFPRGGIQLMRYSDADCEEPEDFCVEADSCRDLGQKM